jgi:hypothetical protein
MTQPILFTGYAKTYRHKSNSCTEWKDFHLVYNKEKNTLDGYGTSRVGRKFYPFVIFGTVIKHKLQHTFEFKLCKVHPTISSYIEYIGVYDERETTTSEINLSIISSESYGTLTLNKS